MKICYRADDGVVFYKKKDCKEYEELYNKALKTIEGFNFRDPDDDWVLNPIIQHDKEEVWKVYNNFLDVTKELALWTNYYKHYKVNEYDEEEEAENKEEWILGIIDGWKEKHHCCFPIRLHDFYGFHAIFRKFEAINFDNGEEYIGSFGSCGDGRERYLEMVKEELKYREEDEISD